MLRLPVLIASLLFTQNAMAQTASGSGDMTSLIFMISIMFIGMYFLVLRPQQKKAKEHQTLISALKKGDEILTSGGIIGRVTHLGDNFLQIEIAPNTEIRIQRGAIISLMPKGSYKGEL